jgi:hypothetical protein
VATACRVRQVRGGAVVRWTPLAVIALCAMTAAGCASSKAAQHAQLRVVSEPAKVSVYMDGKFVATSTRTRQVPLMLEPSTHWWTFWAAGYFPHDLKLTLPAGLTTVQVKLRPIPR